MIKALFLDIDGTLVSFATHQVPASTIEALAQARARGVRIFIATGRPLYITPPFPEFHFDGWVTANGSAAYDENRQPLEQNFLPHAAVEQLAANPPEGVTWIFVDAHRLVVSAVNDSVRAFCTLLNLAEPEAATPWADIVKGNWIQGMCFLEEARDAEVPQWMPGCDTMRWHPAFTDVVPLGASKAHGIDVMCKAYGLALEETAALGDGGNDIPIIRHAGVGIAMGNATPDVKEAADFVTDSVDDDGLARAFAHLGII